MRQNLSRLLMSAAAVVLGVAFVAGTLLFSDGLTDSLSERVGSLDRGTDVDIVDVPADDKLLAQVRTLDGVQAAEALRTALGIGLADKSGRRISGSHVAVTIPHDAALRSYDVAEGRLPDRPGEVVLDTETAKEHHFRVGDDVRIGGRTAARPFTVVGIVDVEGSTVDIGTSVVGLTLDDARALTDESTLERIVVAGDDPGLPARIKALTNLKVRTHKELVEANLDRALGNVTQFRTGLLAFALVSVLVAAFVIANTFTVVLAQRSRENAMLRMIGASRRQLFTSNLAESTAVGLLASLAGLLLGFAVAAGIGAVYPGPSTTPRLTLSSFLIPVVTGTVVTVGAALLPAWRAARVPPITALSDAALTDGRGPRRGRLLTGVLVLAAGIGLLALRSPDLLVVVAGGAVTFLGLVLFGPALVPAVIRVSGWPLAKVVRLVGLARADAVRNPRRIASTAMALVIGIGLVSAFAVGARSIREGAARAIDARYGAAFVVSTFPGELPPELIARLRTEPTLGTVALHYLHDDPGTGADVTSVDPALFSRVQPRAVGEVRALGAGSVVVRNMGDARPGGSVTVAGRNFRVVAVLPGSPGRPEIFMTEPDFRSLYPDATSDLAELDPAPGVAANTARSAVDRLLTDYPAVNLQDRASFKEAQSRGIDQALGFVTALLALAVFISLIGVANTLSLSVVERTREHALLRALGLTAPQLRWLLATEAMLVALAGAILGVTMGIGVIASAMTAVSASNAGTATFHLVLPWGQLLLIVGGATVAALLASVLPARRALSRPPVESLSA